MEAAIEGVLVRSGLRSIPVALVRTRDYSDSGYCSVDRWCVVDGRSMRPRC